jgi:hypothetical protein
MRRPKHQMISEEDLFVGIDLHKNRWHETIRTVDLELFSCQHSRDLGSIAPSVISLSRPSPAGSL